MRARLLANGGQFQESCLGGVEHNYVAKRADRAMPGPVPVGSSRQRGAFCFLIFMAGAVPR